MNTEETKTTDTDTTNAKPKKKSYMTGMKLYNFMQNSRAVMISTMWKVKKDGLTKDDYIARINHIFNNNDFRDRLNAVSQVELMSYKNCLIDSVRFECTVRYEINGKTYSSDELIERKDGLEPNMADATNCGYYHTMPDGSFKKFD